MTCSSTVNRSYFDVLHAQGVVKVAQETVATRQLLSDQVTELARNNLKSQLDVSFAEVNVSEAKLLLLRAQDSVQQAFAELSRAMGSDQLVNYQLADEPLPAGPPATAETWSRRPSATGLSLRVSAFRAMRRTNSRRLKRTCRGQPSVP